MRRDSPRSAPPELTTAAARAFYGPALPVLRRLREQGHQAWLVGGGIRDLILGREPLDWDVATSAGPAAVMELWPQAVPTGVRHGTVTLPLREGPVEITTYRTEGPYTDGRHPDWVNFGASLEEDLARRDFTVNAMAFDPETATLVDPEGGIEDLAGRVIRTVGDPDARFREDGLRPLRGIRFAAVLEFSVDPETLAAIARARDGVARVARERVRDELLKLLGAPRPSIGIELLRQTGLLGGILPELLDEVGVAQNRFHAHDVYEHSLHAVDAVPRERPLVRLAALLHDIGKPSTRAVVDGEGTFYNHQRVGAEMARDILERLRFSRDDRDLVSHLVDEHMFHYTQEWSDGAVRRFLRRVGTESLDDQFQLREADNAARGVESGDAGTLGELRARIDAVLARREAIAVQDLAVQGDDVMRALGIGPGPEVGRALHALLDRVLEDPGLNERERLLALLGEMGRTT
jgi:tRNA nucleotidyltransferase (CCA-adding enzyme)